MSKIPSRFENGAYNFKNLGEYQKGYVECLNEIVDEVIEEEMESIINECYDAEDSRTIQQKINVEAIHLFVEKLKEKLDIYADEINCSFIEDMEE